ncbi:MULTISPECIES: MarP family serine protease [unclassified Nesterenkonia]|uniref:MarP family serine protease n=1 Tax=unclassified Nesterenkonia TaxID=2629769 RepID=UPI000A19D60A|nr:MULTISPECIES: MarP family serine protease [unclassified Nesterenkonia]MDS2171135.1 MarP family serine protease [Nesterenkonia sp. CL21]OSM44071.1 serine protease [Nesterenkonia sp. PF2B19]
MGVTLLDVILVLVLLGFLIAGLRKGIWITVGGLAGFLVGAVAAFFSIPLVAGWVPDPLWRIVAVIATAIVLVVAGHALGTTAGAEVQRMFRSPTVRTLGSLVGGALNVVVAVFVIAALSLSVGAMGFPQVNQHMRQSSVLQGITSVMPERAEAWIAQIRARVMESDIPELAQTLVPESDEAPDSEDLSAAADQASQSVARITGVADQCGLSQSGSGFVVSPTRVVTNAHVVAGVNEPTVELRDGQVASARVVHFDAAEDLALLAVDGLDAAPLEIGDPLDPGDTGFVMGYPAGGPFHAGTAVVQARDVSQVNNIYGSSPSSLEIYQLNADVRQGNSGGPLIDADGDVAGVVFARAMEGSAVGFALTAEEAGDVLTSPDSYTEAVSTGQCVER